jgi:hypothetical protein
VSTLSCSTTFLESWVVWSQWCSGCSLKLLLYRNRNACSGIAPFWMGPIANCSSLGTWTQYIVESYIDLEHVSFEIWHPSPRFYCWRTAACCLTWQSHSHFFGTSDSSSGLAPGGGLAGPGFERCSSQDSHGVFPHFQQLPLSRGATKG